MVRPQLEYTSIVWDPIYNNDVHRIENIQRRAARWIMKDYRSYFNATTTFLARTPNSIDYNHSIKLSTMIPYLYLPHAMTRETRQFNHHHFILPLTSTTAYQRGEQVQEYHNPLSCVISFIFLSTSAVLAAQ